MKSTNGQKEGLNQNTVFTEASADLIGGHLLRFPHFLATLIACILHVCLLSCFRPIQIFEALWTIAHQVPPSMGFPRQEYWRGYQALVQGIFLTQG